MKFAKTVVYVEDAKASLEFFEKAFGLKTRAFYDEGFGEVETGGDTTIAFANYGVGQGHLERYVAGRRDQVGFELSLVSEFELSLVSENVEEDSSAPSRPARNPCRSPRRSRGGRSPPTCACRTAPSSTSPRRSRTDGRLCSGHR
jgi:lactoylglutathione lyase